MADKSVFDEGLGFSSSDYYPPSVQREELIVKEEDCGKTLSPWFGVSPLLIVLWFSLLFCVHTNERHCRRFVYDSVVSDKDKLALQSPL